MALTLRAAGRRAIIEPLESRNLLTAGPTADNVLVLYNSASASGAQIANYYAQVHPGVHLAAISGVDPNVENITADSYLSTIRPQVLAALTPGIDVIVTTKGLPLRIQVTESPPTYPTYTDPSGIVRTIQNWQAFSSLESELTNVTRVSTWLMMGDQSYNIPGGNFVNNLYFGSTAAFDHNAYGGMLLAARLDGYSVSDVLGAIDRAQHAFVGPDNSPTGPYYFLVDNDPTKTYASTMANLVNQVLVPAGLPVVYDNTSAFVSTAPGPVIGYDSHGVHQASTPANYLTAGLNVTLADGAVFNSWESYNACSFTPGGYSGNQGQVAQWLAEGGTAGVGNVEEPGANWHKVANEDQLFKSLLAGRTWAEAAWSSFVQLGYVNTVVGDPLMKWNRLPDANSSMIVGRSLFYNNSSFDAYSAAANANDDLAIAVDKTAYLALSTPATYSNVSNYLNGINGIMIDIAGSHGTITANDFVFKVGNNNSPAGWQAAPAPSPITVRAGAGYGSADRVEIIWPSGSISDEWLEVQVKGNDALGGWNVNTRLAATDVFFFGHATADSGTGNTNGFAVNATDEQSVRNDPHGLGNPAAVANANDINRDGFVNATDQAIVRASTTTLYSQLAMLNLSASGPFAPLIESSTDVASSAVASNRSSSLSGTSASGTIKSLDSAIASALAFGAPASDSTIEGQAIATTDNGLLGASLPPQGYWQALSEDEGEACGATQQALGSDIVDHELLELLAGQQDA